MFTDKLNKMVPQSETKARIVAAGIIKLFSDNKAPVQRGT